MAQPGRTFIRIAALCALAATFALGGCGRKGSLDPPPGTSSQAMGPAQAQAPAAPEPAQGDGPGPAAAQSAAPATDADGGPVAPKGKARRLPADWLID